MARRLTRETDLFEHLKHEMVSSSPIVQEKNAKKSLVTTRTRMHTAYRAIGLSLDRSEIGKRRVVARGVHRGRDVSIRLNPTTVHKIGAHVDSLIQLSEKPTQDTIPSFLVLQEKLAAKNGQEHPLVHKKAKLLFEYAGMMYGNDQTRRVDASELPGLVSYWMRVLDMHGIGTILSNFERNTHLNGKKSVERIFSRADVVTLRERLAGRFDDTHKLLIPKNDIVQWLSSFLTVGHENRTIRFQLRTARAAKDEQEQDLLLRSALQMYLAEHTAWGGAEIQNVLRRYLPVIFPELANFLNMTHIGSQAIKPGFHRDNYYR